MEARKRILVVDDEHRIGKVLRSGSSIRNYANIVTRYLGG